MMNFDVASHGYCQDAHGVATFIAEGEVLDLHAVGLHDISPSIEENGNLQADNCWREPHGMASVLVARIPLTASN
jgi:hypothetical protein